MRLRQKTRGISGRMLTSTAAARFLGVSEASVKRWADSGLLPAEKTAGGHRRFRPEDVFLMRKAKPSDHPPIQKRVAGNSSKSNGDTAARHPGKRARLSSKQKKALIQETFQFLTEGRTEDLSSLVVNLTLNGLGVSAIADQFLCPAMRRVGDLWYRGELSIAVEHLATRTAMLGVERLRAVNRNPDISAMPALCCSTEGDFHELPVLLAAATLEEQGFEVILLGASMPFFALSEAVQKFKPRLICVAATIQLVNLEPAVRDYAQLYKLAQRAGSAIVLGGAGFEGVIRSRLPAGLHAESFEQLEQFAEAIIQEVNDE